MGFICAGRKKKAKERAKQVTEQANPLAKDVLGFHIIPLSIQAPTEQMIKETYSWASWAVVNAWRIWWMNQWHRPKIEQLFRWLVESGAKILVRCDDPSTTRGEDGWKGEPGTENTIEPGWFNKSHTPYILDLLKFHHQLKKECGIGFAGLIHDNEPWVKSNYVVNQSGKKLTAQEYLNYLTAFNTVVHGADPDMPVHMAHITTVTETEYYNKFRGLVNAGLFTLKVPITKTIGAHAYWKDVSSSNISRLEWIRDNTGDYPLIVGEVGHHNVNASDAARTTMLIKQFNIMSGLFKERLKAWCPFALNSIRSSGLLGGDWHIWGTSVWNALKNAVKG